MTIVLDTCALIWWSVDPDKLLFFLSIDGGLRGGKRFIDWGFKLVAAPNPPYHICPLLIIHSPLPIRHVLP